MEDYEFGDYVPTFVRDMGNSVGDAGAKGFINLRTIVLLLIGGLLLASIVRDYVLYKYEQKTLPAEKKKSVSMKKMKRERLKQDVSALEE